MHTDHKYHNRGLCKELLLGCIRYGKNELKLKQIVADTTIDNVGMNACFSNKSISQSTSNQCWFTKVGTHVNELGHWINYMIDLDSYQNF